ncbi:MAG: leucine-rich repeat protein [Clostridium sp.]
MRKQSKSLLSMILTAAMVVSLGAGVTGEKSKAADATKIAPEFTAYLVQNNSKIFNGTDRVVKDSTGAVKQVDAAYKLAAGETEEVNGGFVASTGAISTTGTYTVSAVAEDDVDDLLTEASYLGVEFGTLGAKDVSGKKNYVVPSTYSIKPKTITITGADGKVKQTLDWSKASVYNDGNKATGKLRAGIVNNYCSTSASKADEFQKANPFMTNANGTWTNAGDPVEVVAGDTLAVTLEVSAEAPVVTPTPKPTVAPTKAPALKTYDAYLGFQTDNYIFRNAWNDSTLGLKSKDIKYNSQVSLSTGDKYKAYPAKIANATMKANGTNYTVSISGVNLKTIKGVEKDAKTAKGFNMLYVTTQIPLTQKGVTAVNATLKIDGKVVKSGFSLPNKPDADEYYQFMVADGYSEDDGIKNVAYPKGKDANSAMSSLTTLPTSSMEITFQLKGASFEAAKTIGYKKGAKFESGNFKYQVTKVATATGSKKTKGVVTVVGLSKKGKKASKLSVGTSVSKTVSKVKATYKINKLGKNAFKGAKAKKVTLGKTIKSIPAGAFKNCKKLSKLTLKAKVSVKKGAFKGCKKTIKVTAASKKAKKAQLKKLKKSGYKKFK